LAEVNLTGSACTSGLPTLGPLSLNPVSLLAIRMQEIYRSFASNYDQLLNEMVFSPGGLIDNDRKKTKSFKTTLLSCEANTVLLVLWRESRYVTEDDLAYDGYSKLFMENPLTAYRLAVYLSPTKNEVAATNSRVRLIVTAGTAFGLIHKRQLAPTNIHISGTELLHNFMVRLGLENANSCAQVMWQDPEARISPNSFYNWERFMRQTKHTVSSTIGRRVLDSPSVRIAAWRAI
jgi:hypothetical protein